MTTLFQLLHHGTTVLHLDTDTNQVTPVFLKLENCNGTITWFRPPWCDPRKTSGILINADDTGLSLDKIEDAVSPGLRLKYTNR